VGSACALAAFKASATEEYLSPWRPFVVAISFNVSTLSPLAIAGLQK